VIRCWAALFLADILPAYCSTDCLRRCGAAVKNLSHSASFESCDKNAPLNAGTKHLVLSDDLSWASSFLLGRPIRHWADTAKACRVRNGSALADLSFEMHFRADPISPYLT
jgi:hypothetical protein